MKIIQHSISINIPMNSTLDQIIEILQHAKEQTKDIDLTTTSERTIFFDDLDNTERNQPIKVGAW